MKAPGIHELALAGQAIVTACRVLLGELGKPQELEAISAVFRACFWVLMAVVVTEWQKPSGN